ncbi:unnamed protein product [Amoebophrya sp. A120]|nr:unnamed protein product [Amoebophrya sp. A120]|eukprot:GSA120T00007832001.1
MTSQPPAPGSHHTKMPPPQHLPPPPSHDPRGAPPPTGTPGYHPQPRGAGTSATTGVHLAGVLPGNPPPPAPSPPGGLQPQSMMPYNPGQLHQGTMKNGPPAPPGMMPTSQHPATMQPSSTRGLPPGGGSVSPPPPPAMLVPSQQAGAVPRPNIRPPPGMAPAGNGATTNGGGAGNGNGHPLNQQQQQRGGAPQGTTSPTGPPPPPPPPGMEMVGPPGMAKGAGKMGQHQQHPAPAPPPGIVAGAGVGSSTKQTTPHMKTSNVVGPPPGMAAVAPQQPPAGMAGQQPSPGVVSGGNMAAQRGSPPPMQGAGPHPQAAYIAVPTGYGAPPAGAGKGQPLYHEQARYNNVAQPPHPTDPRYGLGPPQQPMHPAGAMPTSPRPAPPAGAAPAPQELQPRQRMSHQQAAEHQAAAQQQAQNLQVQQQHAANYNNNQTAIIPPPRRSKQARASTSTLDEYQARWVKHMEVNKKMRQRFHNAMKAKFPEYTRAMTELQKNDMQDVYLMVGMRHCLVMMRHYIGEPSEEQKLGYGTEQRVEMTKQERHDERQRRKAERDKLREEQGATLGAARATFTSTGTAGDNPPADPWFLRQGGPSGSADPAKETNAASSKVANWRDAQAEPTSSYFAARTTAKDPERGGLPRAGSKAPSSSASQYDVVNKEMWRTVSTLEQSSPDSTTAAAGNGMNSNSAGKDHQNKDTDNPTDDFVPLSRQRQEQERLARQESTGGAGGLLSRTHSKPLMKTADKGEDGEDAKTPNSWYKQKFSSSSKLGDHDEPGSSSSYPPRAATEDNSTKEKDNYKNWRDVSKEHDYNEPGSGYQRRWHYTQSGQDGAKGTTSTSNKESGSRYDRFNSSNASTKEDYFGGSRDEDYHNSWDSNHRDWDRGWKSKNKRDHKYGWENDFFDDYNNSDKEDDPYSNWKPDALDNSNSYDTALTNWKNEQSSGSYLNNDSSNSGTATTSDSWNNQQATGAGAVTATSTTSRRQQKEKEREEDERREVEAAKRLAQELEQTKQKLEQERLKRLELEEKKKQESALEEVKQRKIREQIREETERLEKKKKQIETESKAMEVQRQKEAAEFRRLQLKQREESQRKAREDREREERELQQKRLELEQWETKLKQQEEQARRAEREQQEHLQRQHSSTAAPSHKQLKVPLPPPPILPSSPPHADLEMASPPSGGGYSSYQSSLAGSPGASIDVEQGQQQHARASTPGQHHPPGTKGQSSSQMAGKNNAMLNKAVVTAPPMISPPTIAPPSIPTPQIPTPQKHSTLAGAQKDQTSDKKAPSSRSSPVGPASNKMSDSVASTPAAAKTYGDEDDADYNKNSGSWKDYGNNNKWEDDVDRRNYKNSWENNYKNDYGSSGWKDYDKNEDSGYNNSRYKHYDDDEVAKNYAWNKKKYETNYDKYDDFDINEVESDEERNEKPVQKNYDYRAGKTKHQEEPPKPEPVLDYTKPVEHFTGPKAKKKVNNHFGALMASQDDSISDDEEGGSLNKSTSSKVSVPPPTAPPPPESSNLMLNLTNVAVAAEPGQAQPRFAKVRNLNALGDQDHGDESPDAKDLQAQRMQQNVSAAALAAREAEKKKQKKLAKKELKDPLAKPTALKKGTAGLDNAPANFGATGADRRRYAHIVESAKYVPPGAEEYYEQYEEDARLPPSSHPPPPPATVAGESKPANFSSTLSNKAKPAPVVTAKSSKVANPAVSASKTGTASAWGSSQQNQARASTVGGSGSAWDSSIGNNRGRAGSTGDLSFDAQLELAMQLSLQEQKQSTTSTSMSRGSPAKAVPPPAMPPVMGAAAGNINAFPAVPSKAGVPPPAKPVPSTKAGGGASSAGQSTSAGSKRKANGANGTTTSGPPPPRAAVNPSSKEPPPPPAAAPAHQQEPSPNAAEQDAEQLLKEFLRNDPWYADMEKNRKKLDKKLREITKLEEQDLAGAHLQTNQMQKIMEKPEIEQQLKKCEDELLSMEADMREQQNIAKHSEERAENRNVLTTADKSEMTARQKARARLKANRK